MFLLRRELGHRAAVSGDDEHRVVAEAGVAAWRPRDLTTHLALEKLDVSVGRREGGDAHEPRGAVLDTVEKSEQLRVALFGARVVAEEAPAAPTGIAATR